MDFEVGKRYYTSSVNSQAMPVVDIVVITACLVNGVRIRSLTKENVDDLGHVTNPVGILKSKNAEGALHLTQLEALEVLLHRAKEYRATMGNDHAEDCYRNVRDAVMAARRATQRWTSRLNAGKKHKK